MLEHYRFRLLRQRRVAGRRPGQGQARRRARPGEPRPAAPGRRAPAARTDGGIQLHARVQGRRHRRLAVGGDAAAQPASRASGPPRTADWMREGWDRRGARSRLDRRRSLKESVKRRAPRGRTRRPSPTRTCASGSWRAAGSRPCTRWCSSCWTSRAACPTVTASSPRPSSSGWPQGLRREYKAARHRVRRAHHRGLGVQRAGLLPGHRQRRHGRLGGARQGARDHGGALRPGGAATSICSTPPTATTPSDDRAPRRRAALDASPGDACYTGYVEIASGVSRAARYRDRQAVRRARRRRAAPPVQLRAQ